MGRQQRWKKNDSLGEVKRKLMIIICTGCFSSLGQKSSSPRNCVNQLSTAAGTALHKEYPVHRDLTDCEHLKATLIHPKVYKVGPQYSKGKMGTWFKLSVSQLQRERKCTLQYIILCSQQLIKNIYQVLVFNHIHFMISFAVTDDEKCFWSSLKSTDVVKT